jgi:hypothetical protein
MRISINNLLEVLNWFVHIAIITNPHKGDAIWLEPVTDKEYNKIKLEGMGSGKFKEPYRLFFTERK